MKCLKTIKNLLFSGQFWESLTDLFTFNLKVPETFQGTADVRKLYPAASCYAYRVHNYFTDNYEIPGETREAVNLNLCSSSPLTICTL